jgi:hypothetical protein
MYYNKEALASVQKPLYFTHRQPWCKAPSLKHTHNKALLTLRFSAVKKLDIKPDEIKDTELLSTVQYSKKID